MTTHCMSRRLPWLQGRQCTCRVLPKPLFHKGHVGVVQHVKLVFVCRASTAQLQPRRVLPAQVQVPQKLRPTEGQPPHRGSGSRSAWLPEWQRVPGTSFVVDKFRSVQNVVCRHWFLSHFHADHYGGLSGRFCQGAVLALAAQSGSL